MSQLVETDEGLASSKRVDVSAGIRSMPLRLIISANGAGPTCHCDSAHRRFQ
jgi:hypothetical protein